MKVFRNSDGSYDVLNSKNELFHVVNVAKKIGHVTPLWKHNSKQLRRLSRQIMNMINLFEP